MDELIERSDYFHILEAISNIDLSYRLKKETKDKKWCVRIKIFETKYKDVWPDGFFVDVQCSSKTEESGVGYSFSEVKKMGYDGFRNKIHGHCHLPVPEFEQLSMF